MCGILISLTLLTHGNHLPTGVSVAFVGVCCSLLRIPWSMAVAMASVCKTTSTCRFLAFSSSGVEYVKECKCCHETAMQNNVKVKERMCIS